MTTETSVRPTLERAATARAAGGLRAADRPQQRRYASHPDAAPVTVTRSPGGLQLRAQSDAGDSPLEFAGYASVTGAGYEMYDMWGPYTEVVDGGSFEKNLGQADLDVPLVLAHDSLRRIARTTTGTLTLAEDETGLSVLAPELDAADQDVAYIAPKIRAGLIDEMSFRFFITRGQWSSDWTEFHIQEVDIHRGDVAIVGYGANPFTSANLRSAVDKLQHGRDLGDRDAQVLSQALGQYVELDGVIAQARTALAAFAARQEGHDDATGAAALATDALAALRRQESEIREQLRSAGQTPAMSLQELLKL